MYNQSYYSDKQFDPYKYLYMSFCIAINMIRYGCMVNSYKQNKNIFFSAY